MYTHLVEDKQNRERERERDGSTCSRVSIVQASYRKTHMIAVFYIPFQYDINCPASTPLKYPDIELIEAI